MAADGNRKYTIMFERPHPLTWMEDRLDKIKLMAGNGRPFLCNIDLWRYPPPLGDYAKNRPLRIDQANKESIWLAQAASEVFFTFDNLLFDTVPSEYAAYFVDKAYTSVRSEFGKAFADGLTNAQYIDLFDAAHRMKTASAGEYYWIELQPLVRKYQAEVAAILCGCGFVGDEHDSTGNPFGRSYLCEKRLEGEMLKAFDEFTDYLKTLVVYENGKLIDKFDYVSAERGRPTKSLKRTAVDMLGCKVSDIEFDLRYWDK